MAELFYFGAGQPVLQEIKTVWCDIIGFDHALLCIVKYIARGRMTYGIHLAYRLGACLVISLGLYIWQYTPRHDQNLNYNTLPLVTFVFSRDILNNQTLSTRHGQNFCDVKFSYADTGQHRGRLFSKRYVLYWRITTIKTFWLAKKYLD